MQHQRMMEVVVAQPGIRTVKLPSSEPIPVLGQGTWGLGEDRQRRSEELAALRLGLDLGMTLIDTAEMYGNGAAERLVGAAIAGHRDEVFVVDKLLPANATRAGTVAACEGSLHRLGTDRIDMYLLHWRGPVPLEETVDAFIELVDRGLIRHWGVSNFDVADLVELTRLPGGRAVETDQVLYSLTRRGIEWDLLPLCRDAGLPIIAYAPLEHGRVPRQPVLAQVAARHGVTPVQVALAWVLRQDDVCAIPKASTPEHTRDNRDALELHLTEEDLAVLDQAFPPPTGPRPLEML
jgi:diketogulonate reductase-like aldo/keto reductase